MPARCPAEVLPRTLFSQISGRPFQWALPAGLSSTTAHRMQARDSHYDLACEPARRKALICFCLESQNSRAFGFKRISPSESKQCSGSLRAHTRTAAEAPQSTHTGLYGTLSAGRTLEGEFAVEGSARKAKLSKNSKLIPIAR